LQEQAILEEYHQRIELARNSGDPAPQFPEHLLVRRLDNTWHDTAEAVVGNWMGCIYQVTHSDRRRPFMDYIDPENPLGIRDAIA